MTRLLKKAFGIVYLLCLLFVVQYCHVDCEAHQAAMRHSHNNNRNNMGHMNKPRTNYNYRKKLTEHKRVHMHFQVVRVHVYFCGSKLKVFLQHFPIY